MATSTVSTLGQNTNPTNPENWQLIDTKTCDGNGLYTFSGLGGAYKKLMITWSISSKYGGQYIYTRINGDSSNLYGGGSQGGSNIIAGADRVYLEAWGNNNSVGYVIVENCDQADWPKVFSGSGTGSINHNGVYFGTSAVTSISFAEDSWISTGTIKLYGSVA